jgi:UDP-N-acetylmuramoylalanine--D-glutamate ligase
MIRITEYVAQNVGVFGLGKAGEAAVAALKAGGATVWTGDDKMPDSIKSWPWDKLKALILSPGVPLTHPAPHTVVKLANKHRVPIIGDIELLFRACSDARIVAITGTNGKSTTTTLIGHILKSCGMICEVGGNLGTPALALAPLGKDGTYVLELSSYQLDLVKTTRFTIAVWLNISPDHIDRHGSLEGYVRAKERLFARQQAGDTAIVSIDDEHSNRIADMLKYVKKQTVVDISVQKKTEGIYVEKGILHDGKHRFDLNPIVTLIGTHNWQNAASAYAAAKACGLAPDAIYAAMKNFAGLRHRLQLVATIGGVRFINDSKATNADATSNALAPYEHIYWIAGGKPKEGGIASLAKYFPKIAHAFLIGEAENQFAETLKGHASYTLCGTLKSAVEKAAAMAFSEKKKNAVVLLSPACASFDQFKNFEERGDMFCDLIEELASAHMEKAS